MNIEHSLEQIARKRQRRAELIRLVSEGLDYREAESLAAVEGVGSLLDNPTFDDIDGFAEPQWTLLMAFAWVAWGRNPMHVRSYFPDYRNQSREWRLEGKGHVPAPLPLRTAYHAVEQTYQDWHGDFTSALKPDSEKPRLTLDKLKAKFRAGQIATCAQLVNDPSAGFVPIPAQNWQSLLLMPPTGLLVDALCYADGAPIYFDVR